MIKLMFRISIMLSILMAAANGYAETSIINIYDANGNLVTGDGRYYEYNDANHLVLVKQGDQAGPIIAEYFYDASGQRIKKIENGVTTYYVGKHFEKQVGGTNAGSTSYYFGDGGERVAKKDPAGNIFYYHLDHLDGINAVTDSSGTLVARTDYLPFGDTRTGTSGDKYSYTGMEKDKTNLYYFNARYNSPEFRHFTQADIAEPDYADPQDLNRYSYVGNNPLSFVDYDGFKKKKKHLSKREQRARSLGLNPDKDKYKVGKMSDREYKRALKAHKEAEKKKTTILKSSSIAKTTSGNKSDSTDVEKSNNGKVLGASTLRYGLNIYDTASDTFDYYKTNQTNKKLVASGQVASTFAKERGIVDQLFGLLFSKGLGGKADSLSGGIVKKETMEILDKAVFNRARDACIAAGEEANCLD